MIQMPGKEIRMEQLETEKAENKGKIFLNAATFLKSVTQITGNFLIASA